MSLVDILSILFVKVTHDVKNMKTLWKTRLKKLSVVLTVITIITIFLLIFKHFLLSVINIIVLVILFPIWFRSLTEELVISFLKDNGGYCTYDKLIEEYSGKIIPTISRLEKKSIVEVKDNVISLIDKNYICAFDKFRKK